VNPDLPQRVPILEYVLAVMNERDLRYQQRFDAQEEAIREYKSSSEKRLEGMNEFRGTVSDVIGKCITRDEARAQILASCSITGAAMAVIMVVIGLISFFMRK
jgi:hypothetical protein